MVEAIPDGPGGVALANNELRTGAATLSTHPATRSGCNEFGVIRRGSYSTKDSLECTNFLED